MMMTDFLFNEQVLSNKRHFTHAANAGYAFIGPDDVVSSLDWLAVPAQVAPDFTGVAWPAHENALGLYGMNIPESVWTADQLSCPFTTGTSNPVDTPSFNTSLLCPDGAMRFCEPTTPSPYWHHAISHEAAALFGAGEDLMTPPFFPVTTPECHTKPKRVGAIAQSTPPRSQRYTPYPLTLDNTRKSISSATVYPCQWADGINKPCGAALLNTKYAIGKHLQTAHAIRLKADKTLEMCRWEGCCKSMRRESIARHILAVHMQDKVRCSNCGTHFARTDSLQRHQRTPCIAKEEIGKARK